VEIEKSLLLGVAADADIEPENLRWDYSGRGMYGRECFGIVGRMSDYTRFIVALTQWEDGSELAGDYAWELADRVSTDNMAYDTIFYFPGVKVLDK